MSDDRQQADALNRFWDDLADTDGPPAAADLNADHRETLRQIHAMTRTPPPATARTRVDRAMRERLAVSQNGKCVSTMSQTNTLVPGPLASDPPEWVPWRPAGVLAPGTTSRAMPWAGVNFAFALLLLITLGLGYLSFHPGALPSQRLAALPALVAPATPESAEQAKQTLAVIPLPTGMVPSVIMGSLNHYTIPAGFQAGTGSTWVSTCCNGARFEYIVSGSFTVHSAGPMQVLHGGTSAWETIPAGTEVSVTTGDALLLRMEDAFDAANTGSVPVELVEGNLFEGQVTNDPIPRGWIFHNQDIRKEPFTVPTGPTTLRLQRTTLARGADLPLPADAVLQFAISLEQGAVLDARDDFAVHNLSPQPVVVYVLTLEPAGAETAPLAASPEMLTGEAANTPSR